MRYNKISNRLKRGEGMKELKEEIEMMLRQLENMIENGENKSKIDEQRRRLDTLLEKYLKDI